MWNCAVFFIVAMTAPPAKSDDGANDFWLTLKARIALMTTANVESGAIQVDSRYGTVTLYGRTSSVMAKSAAEKSIAALDGVKRVENLLQVVTPDQAKVVAASDDVIRRTSETTLENAPALAKSDIRVFSVDKGIVMLGGRARDVAAHAHAVDLIDRVNGVARVESRVQVENDALVTTFYYPTEGKDFSSPTPEDSRLTTQVKMRLLGNANIPSLSVDVATRDGIVNLFGTVDSERAKVEAEREALQVNGVVRVNNDLHVSTHAAKNVSVADSEIESNVKVLLSKEDDLKRLVVRPVSDADKSELIFEPIFCEKTGVMVLPCRGFFRGKAAKSSRSYPWDLWDGPLGVAVKDGVVVLSGTVQAEAQKVRAAMTPLQQ